MDNQNIQLKTSRLAVLIDADNANAKIIEPLLKEVSKYGTSHVKRIYGDWTNEQLKPWKSILNEFAIQPIQQFTYTSGKNATDSALIIDAMDLLYTGNFDGFCIVSSDSDFTRLATRIRESGLLVYGFGENKTPQPFVNACDKFIYTEILDTGSSTKQKSSNSSKTTKTLSSKLVTLFKDVYDGIAEEEEWINLGPFGSQLTKISPSFDPRNYGYSKLSTLIKATEVFEVKPQSGSLYIRLKPKSN
ncbi:NYN domain-containing protein [Prochlorothrix hollandica]|uniref:NYN domain-containing protein n=1 Tax=Prochlorothrix hollandica TaxID=1223 RepID=UPI00034A08E8|nr:NYN domain-containing protein [Prochlorothrix hollandica]